MALKSAVTGGAGFIGSHVVDCLKKEGHEVVVIDYKGKPHRDDVAFENADILDLSSLITAIKGCDYIFHLAAVSNVNVAFKYPVYTVRLNIEGTANVLEAARLNGVKRVFFASTVWVYTGAEGNEPLIEDVPFYLPMAGHVYTSSKIAGEMICHNYHQLYNQSFTILRYGIPYGPRMREQLLIPIFIRKALKGEPLTITGDGSQFRNFIFIEDLAKAHIFALSNEARNQTYNLEGKRKVTVNEVAETIKSVLGGKVKIVHTPARPGDYKGKEISATKAEQDIGWKPKIEFEEGIKRTIDWFKKQT